MAGLKRFTMLLAVLLSVLAGVVQAAQPHSGPLKIAFVYASPVGDGGWVYAHDASRKAVEIEFGDRVITKTIVNVHEGQQAETTFRQLAKEGYRLIFGASVGYTDAMIKVAAEFPEVKFDNASGAKTAHNVSAFHARSYEGAYLAGVLAGKMTRTGRLGFVASIPVPEVIRNINAFTLGAQSVNSHVVTQVAWVGTWYDLAKERLAAEELIAHRADVLIQNTNSNAVLKTAQEKGVMAFGWDSDMVQYGPRAHLGSVLVDWSTYYKQRVAEVMRGEWRASNVWLGVRERAIRIASPNPDMSVEVMMLLGERTAALREKKLHPFQGPIVDLSATERVKAGAVISDEELKTMHYLVRGVLGSAKAGPIPY